MLAAIPCGVQTSVGAVMSSMKIGKHDSFAVFGAASVGMSAVMAAKLVEPSPVIAVDVVGARLELARELGATHVIDAIEGDVVERLKEIAPRGARFSFDTTGNERAFNAAIESLAMGGECGIVTVPHYGTKFPYTPMGNLSAHGNAEGHHSRFGASERVSAEAHRMAARWAILLRADPSPPTISATSTKRLRAPPRPCDQAQTDDA